MADDSSLMMLHRLHPHKYMLFELLSSKCNCMRFILWFVDSGDMPAAVAQRLERCFSKAKVDGSIPSCSNLFCWQHVVVIQNEAILLAKLACDLAESARSLGATVRSMAMHVGYAAPLIVQLGSSTSMR